MSPVGINGVDNQGVGINGVQVKQALAAASETVDEGVYDATTLSTVDADLAVGNIKDGVTIFGKLGTFAGAAPTVTLRASGEDVKNTAINTWETMVTVSIPAAALKVILSFCHIIMVGSGSYTQDYRGYYNGVQRYVGAQTGNLKSDRGYWIGDGVGSAADAYCQTKISGGIPGFTTGDILDVT